MYDTILALEILRQIHWSTQTIAKRFQPIKRVEDFLSSDEGLEKLDAICMQLIAIGESLKNLDKVTNSTLLIHYPQVDWSKVKGMRDVLSHQYFDIDAEVVFNVCQTHIETVAQIIRQIITDLENMDLSNHPNTTH